MKIKQVIGYEILDSRGMPTVACQIVLDSGLQVTASVPSGASSSAFSAHELRDGDTGRYFGKGVLKAVRAINSSIAPVLVGMEPDTAEIDKRLLELDGTGDKSHLGSNALLAVSAACLKAQAMSSGTPLFKLIAQLYGIDMLRLPRPMFNIINGGMHAAGGLQFQEFMIMPTTDVLSQSLHQSVNVYYALSELLSAHGGTPSTGDEGGFVPLFTAVGIAQEKNALDLLVQSVEKAGFTPGKDIEFCLDVAASTFYDKNEDRYRVGSDLLTTEELIDVYLDMCNTYPIVSIEDGIRQDHMEGWQQLTEKLGEKVQLVGDDIFATNARLIEQGAEHGIGTAAVIKPNQVGTITETLEAIRTSKAKGYNTVISHRSGETTDTLIADLAVGTGADQFKAGACMRGERVCKYNRLLLIGAALQT